ncbi:MAG: 16S rRNA (guanine(527)-N(7))-methyltransferase RsmG [Aurantimonas endophytica]|uniref:16S rRNA (guanine(527)-N(7))-methyltransferase RsmG n=1 Tax=Aurantimonas endophytica TaxID=1522175 RepID=UPI0030036DB9
MRPDPAQRPKRLSSQDLAALLAEDRARVLEQFTVSRETLARLDRYVDLLVTWQTRVNLIAASTIGEIWTRHVADSLSLERRLPPFQRAVDLGSGAGFPALVIASARPGATVDLIESNAKKAAFLRTVQRETGLCGTVHAARIEDCGAALASADIVTARALASLDQLLGFVAPYIAPSARCFFAKGRSHEQEINAATAHWRFSMVKHESELEDGSVVLEIGDIAPR